MSHDLVPHLPDVNGELQPATPSKAHEVLSAIKTARRRLSDLESDWQQVVHAEMDRAALWTLHVGSGALESASPETEVVDDPHALWEALTPLIDRELISAGARDAAVEVVTTWKARMRGVNQLRRLGGEVAEVVNAHVRTAPRYRKVVVK